MMCLIYYILIIFIFTCDQYKNSNETVPIFSHSVISVQATCTSCAREPPAVLGWNPLLLLPPPPLPPAWGCRGSCPRPRAPVSPDSCPRGERQPGRQSQGPRHQESTPGLAESCVALRVHQPKRLPSKASLPASWGGGARGQKALPSPPPGGEWGGRSQSPGPFYQVCVPSGQTGRSRVLG